MDDALFFLCDCLVPSRVDTLLIDFEGKVSNHFEELSLNIDWTRMLHCLQYQSIVEALTPVLGIPPWPHPMQALMQS